MAVIFCDSIVTCEEFVALCAAVFEAQINAKAEKVVYDSIAFASIIYSICGALYENYCVRFFRHTSCSGVETWKITIGIVMCVCHNVN